MSKYLMFKIAIILAVLLVSSTALLTSKMVHKKYKNASLLRNIQNLRAPDIKTSCNRLTNFANYSGIVASGYLKVDNKKKSALTFIFYGQKDIKDISQLKSVPTLIWLNGGPGSSSQLGNLQQIGPQLIIDQYSVKIVKNNYTWANKYNLLFVDQPVGTGLSYADTTDGFNPFAKTLDQVALDFYSALYQLYNNDNGCFSARHLGIPVSSPLVIFGQSYGGKYAPAIAQTILKKKQIGGLNINLRGIGIGDGFTEPYQILSQVGTFSYHLGLIDTQQRMKLQKMLMNATRHNLGLNWKQLHDDFDNALDYIIQKSGNVNVYDIRQDGDYEELLQPYFWNPANLDAYGLNNEVIYDSNADAVYQNLYLDFMQPEINRVEYLLNKKIPILIYNGQQDLIVQNPGTMKWADRIYHDKAQEFRNQLFTPWKIGNKIVGLKKSAGLLELRIVFGAGHLVPMDQPESALDLVTSFVDRITK